MTPDQARSPASAQATSVGSPANAGSPASAGVSRLSGRRAVVTGAGRGLGRAVAWRLAAEGAGVVAADLNAEDLEQTVAGSPAGGAIVPAVADCSRRDGLEQVFDACATLGGVADALVNNAAVLSGGPVTDVAEEEIERVLRVNTIGPMLATTAFARRLVAAGAPGAVVNIASTTAHIASLPGLSTYAASKGAVLAYTRAAAADLARYGIRVNAVSPGWIRTAMTSGIDDESDAPLLRRIPMRRPAEPAEIAAAVVWLLADDAGYVTGTSMAVDGGWLGY
ncbi:MAG: SDR family NAD(P)-dependent oxidoreductase [Actinomycetota bacterium]|nr:SDR family NAD(P)-dependent oxidoreductase [Actinomycetota bacterium]